IPEYAQALAARLSFDPALSRSVREEVEDHLWEAAGDGSPESQRRAIARFGDPRLIATQIAAAALARQARNIRVMLMLAFGGLFLAMKPRIAWFAFAGFDLCDEQLSLSQLVVTIDRTTFWIAIACGAASLALAKLRLARQRVFFLLCAAAAAGIV